MNELINTNGLLTCELLSGKTADAYIETISVGSRQNYLAEIKNFFEVTDISVISLDIIRSITPEIATKWANDLVESGISKRTVNKKLSYLCNFYRFLGRRSQGLVSYNPFDPEEDCIRFKNVDKGYSDKIPMEPKTVMNMINSIPSENFTDKRKELESKRDYLILTILTTTGMREAELAQIKLKDIKLHKGMWIVYLTGKGGKQRPAQLHDGIIKKINEYLTARGITMEDKECALITGHAYNSVEHACLSTRTIYNTVKKYAKFSGIDTDLISPHVFRHTFADAQRTLGTNVSVISSLLGHSNIKTTQTYFHVTEQLEENKNDEISHMFGLAL